MLCWGADRYRQLSQQTQQIRVANINKHKVSRMRKTKIGVQVKLFSLVIKRVVAHYAPMPDNNINIAINWKSDFNELYTVDKLVFFLPKNQSLKASL